MDTHHVTSQTAAMDTTLKSEITDLLKHARAITLEVMGDAPPALVAEVFRHLCISQDCARAADEWPDVTTPTALH